MNSYIVAVRETKENGKIVTLLLEKKDVAYLLLHVDENKYEIGEIVSTYSEKQDSILPFCKVNNDLETGEGVGNDS